MIHNREIFFCFFNDLKSFTFTCEVSFNLTTTFVSDTALSFEFFPDRLLASIATGTFECNGTNWQKIYRKNDLKRFDLCPFRFRVAWIIVSLSSDLFVVINPSIVFNNRLLDKDELKNRCLGNFNKVKIWLDFVDDCWTSTIDSDVLFSYGYTLIKVKFCSLESRRVDWLVFLSKSSSASVTNGDWERLARRELNPAISKLLRRFSWVLIELVYK